MFHSIIGLHFVLKLFPFGSAVLYLKGMLWPSCEIQTTVPVNLKEKRNPQSYALFLLGRYNRIPNFSCPVASLLVFDSVFFSFSFIIFFLLY